MLGSIVSVTKTALAVPSVLRLLPRTTIAFQNISDKMSTSVAGSNKPLVETEKVGHVYLIGINRPEKRNCVDHATSLELISAFNAFEQSDDLYVAVLYGKGGTFCAGYDLHQVASSDKATQDAGLMNVELDKGYGPMGPSRKIFNKPVIAAVSGYAVAGGLELACMCDLRVLEESAVMGVFCRRFGVPLLDGGTVRLPQLIGLSRALDLILTGRPVSAKEAQDMGLANRVVPNGTSLGEATKLAQTLCNFPQECLRRDRLSAFNSCYSAATHREAVEFEWNNGINVVTAESVQGAKRFVSGIGKKGSFDLQSGNEKSKL